MSTQVLDLVTIASALTKLGEDFLNDPEWQGCNDAQHDFLDWFIAHREEIRTLDSFDAVASTNYELLNAFLRQRGFAAMFEKFDGIGVASVLDMLVQWAKAGEVTRVGRRESGTERDVYGRRQEETVYYPAFEIEEQGVHFWQVAGFEHPLAQLRTTTDHSLWLMQYPSPEWPLDLALTAQKILGSADRRPHPTPMAGVVVPMLDVDLTADLSWLAGMESVGPAGHYYVEQAFQQFKLRANETGARVKVATGISVAMAACAPLVYPYVFNEPFLGFITQPGHDSLPLAVFWADTDSWTKPAGSLEDL